ncbi:MAG: UDP-N-acetylglucosamine 2-epimerase (non-hydrolyzing) [Firmicutes bacterium]|nr:UDP-N-acetylglucosamine 2-epimerase (non-hydrolyzing) [Bacillota bacterium]
MLKVLSVFGTRPEAIKMAPLVKELEKDADIESKIAVTAQHREMLDAVMQLFGLQADYDLNIMRGGQTPAGITCAALTGLCEVIEAEKPDLVLVHGDTTTTLSGALAAFYNKIPCGHVEAGLRTDNKYSPYPEEMNRRLTGVMADLHFAPTEQARKNLLRDGVAEQNIFITGNTVIDALHMVTEDNALPEFAGAEKIDWQKKIILLTCHRRESWGKPMQEIFAAIADILRADENLELVFPVHLNPLVREAAHAAFDGTANAHLIEPLDYLPFSRLMQHSHLVVTDSGGIQEEAPALGKPVLVLREVTERPEAIEAGTAKLIGNSYQGVYEGVRELLYNEEVYAAMAHAANPFGDGHASERICEIIKKSLQK